MKRGRIILFGALLVLAAGVVALWPRGPKEPVYQGKPLLKWLSESYYCYDGSAQMKRDAATSAVKASGTNALPFLLSSFEGRRSDPKIKINRLLSKLRINAFRFVEETDPLPAAAYGVQLLGPDAAPALPILARHLENYAGEDSAGAWAGSAMVAIGEPALPYLRNVLASSNVTARSYGIHILGSLARSTVNVFPSVLSMLQDPNPQIRGAAAKALRGAPFKQELAASALTQVLSDTNVEVQEAAVYSVGTLKSAAKCAVPQLQLLTRGTNTGVACLASNALFHIDPAALPQK